VLRVSAKTTTLNLETASNLPTGLRCHLHAIFVVYPLIYCALSDGRISSWK